MKYLFITLALLTAHFGFAQDKTLTGILLDIDNKVVKKYPVTLGKEKPVTVKTDKYGIFTFNNANLQDTLYVGDKKGNSPIAIPINGHPFVTIKSLKGNFNTEYLSEPDEWILRQLKQIEKDKKKKSNMMTREDIEMSGCLNIACLLVRFSGVRVEGEMVYIGGMNSSFTLGTNALIVIDGVPNALGGIEIPIEDVEDITVLKDASIYGVRGANGAVQINTRKR
jgi:TonB-dependent SusC/RagA subfamily outer membrane receptor